MKTPQPNEPAMLAALADDTILDLFGHACETGHETAADALEAEIARRGLWGRKPGAE